MFRRKPLRQIDSESDHQELEKQFGLFSLLSVGIGGTVGSGIFVLSGSIARSLAGPSTCLSWLLAGVVCLFTASTYAELSCLIPSTGSTYIFAYHALGELLAVAGGWLLTLEYGVGGAAVARSWGDKLAFWVGTLGLDASCVPANKGDPVACWVNSLFGTSVNLAACLISVLATLVLLRGGDLGRQAINVLVVLKTCLVLFVIVLGMTYVQAANLSPFIPPPHVANASPAATEVVTVGGTRGIFLGATVAFFGFIGFDEVTCLSAETIDAPRTVPRAVFGTIISVTVLYMLASLTLTGMVPYHQISPEEGFGSAFESVGCTWAVNIVMFGQISVVLPTVVLVSYFPQSRLQYAMAKDGMLPAVFAKVDANGSIFWGTLIGGALLTAIATCVPFDDLNDIISGGVLLSFIMSNCSLLMVRARASSPSQANDQSVRDGQVVYTRAWSSRVLRNPGLMVACYTFVACSLAFSVVYDVGVGWVVVQGLVAVALVVGVWLCIPNDKHKTDDKSSETYRAPFVPLFPCVAIFMNWYLIAQLTPKGIGLMVVYILASALSYVMYGLHHSVGRRTNNWELEHPEKMEHRSWFHWFARTYQLLCFTNTSDSAVCSAGDVEDHDESPLMQTEMTLRRRSLEVRKDETEQVSLA